MILQEKHSAEKTSLENKHIIDQISLGKIVQIRDKLLKTQATGKKVYRFESGDPSFDIAPHVQAAIQQAVADGKTHYTPNNGILELREAIKNKLEKKNHIILPSIESIFVTNGAMNGLFATFSSLLSRGDEVIIPEPMWTEIAENIKFGRGTPVPIPLSMKNNFEYSPLEIEEKITAKTKAIFINSPHNPTGSVLSRETMMEIIELAKKYDLWIISDEAYEDIIYKPYKHYSVASLAPDYAEKIVSLFSFSKSHAMSGLRLGYIVTTSALLKSRIPKVLRCSINGTNSIAQWAAVAALEGDQSYIESMKKEYLIRRDLLYLALKEVPGINPFYPRGSFYIWAELESSIYERLDCKDAEAISNYLAGLGIGSTPGNAFGVTCENSLRFAFSCATKMVEEGAIALKEALQRKL